MKRKRKAGALAAVALVLTLASGCTSNPMMVVPKPPANPTRLGHVEGRASGSQFLELFPIGTNSRTRRAYERALAQRPDAKALMDVTLQEDWIWYYLGTVRTVTITGEAVK